MLLKRSPSLLVFACGFAAVLGFLALNSTARADIVWSAPVTISGDSDVSAVGSTLYAYDWSGSSVSVNGVSFNGTTSQTSRPARVCR